MNTSTTTTAINPYATTLATDLIAIRQARVVVEVYVSETERAGIYAATKDLMVAPYFVDVRAQRCSCKAGNYGRRCCHLEGATELDRRLRA